MVWLIAFIFVVLILSYKRASFSVWGVALGVFFFVFMRING